MENKETSTVAQQLPKNIEKPQRPNENGQILVDGAVRIFDPDTKEIFVEVRT
jgi:hypothetical protein